MNLQVTGFAFKQSLHFQKHSSTQNDFDSHLTKRKKKKSHKEVYNENKKSLPYIKQFKKINQNNQRIGT